MYLLSDFIKGVFIGSGAILPGISSGVICIVLGIYEKLLNSVLNFFKDIKANIKFLFPIFIGGITGIMLFSNVILYCFNTIPCQTKSLFIGLLLGSIYILAQTNLQSCVNIKNNISNYLSLIICLVIGLGLIYLEDFISIRYNHTDFEFNSLFLILSGFFMSIGIVVPRS